MRKIMCITSKKHNMEGYKLKDLKLKEFDSIQDMFDKALKRQKVEDDKETTELKQLMKIIPDEEEVAIDAIPLVVKSPSIVGKFYQWFSALMFSSLIASVWALRILKVILVEVVMTNALTRSGLIRSSGLMHLSYNSLRLSKMVIESHNLKLRASSNQLALLMFNSSVQDMLKTFMGQREFLDYQSRAREIARY
ncbi:hypothetical protein Tco_0809228 [Tanacetum coccineum]